MNAPADHSYIINVLHVFNQYAFPEIDTEKKMEKLIPLLIHHSRDGQKCMINELKEVLCSQMHKEVMGKL